MTEERGQLVVDTLVAKKPAELGEASRRRNGAADSRTGSGQI
jgi:hypothetical protein